MRVFFGIMLALLLALPAQAAEDTETAAVFKEHCSECHGAGRLGAIGPALLPENLKRLRKKQAVATIATRYQPSE